MGVREGTGVSSDLKNEMASSGCAGHRRAERHRSYVVGEGQGLEHLRKLKHWEVE